MTTAPNMMEINERRSIRVMERANTTPCRQDPREHHLYVAQGFKQQCFGRMEQRLLTIHQLQSGLRASAKMRWHGPELLGVVVRRPDPFEVAIIVAGIVSTLLIVGLLFMALQHPP